MNESQLVKMRDPCPMCGGSIGELRSKNFQHPIYCVKCGAWAYNYIREVTFGEPFEYDDDLPQENLIDLRRPCMKCANDIGMYRISGNQRPVHCYRCGVYQQYNAAHYETGERPKNSKSVKGIPSSQRYRILERDGFRCRYCGATPEDGVTKLHVDHMMSKADSIANGIGRGEMNSDENLVTACVDCNLGKGRRSLRLRVA